MIVSMPPNDAYRETFDRIFGERPIKHGEDIGKFSDGREEEKE